jgi:hypothetical protein
VVGNVLRRTFDTLSRYWQSFAGIALAIGALYALVGIAFSFVFEDAVEEANAGLDVDLGDLLGVALIGLLVTFGVSLVFNAVFVAMFRDADADGDPDVTRALQLVFARFWNLLAVVVLSVIAVFVGLLLLIIPGIWMAISLVPIVAVVLFEDEGVTGTIGRSISLVRGNWWPVFGIVLLLGLLNFVLGLFTRFPGAIGLVLAVVASAINLVVQASAMYFTYDELRRQKDFTDAF